MYIKRLRTYKRTGFTLWTGDFQVKQNINVFMIQEIIQKNLNQDIVEADKSVVISKSERYFSRIN